MDFTFDEAYYLFIEDCGNKSIVKLVRNYEWDYETIDGICHNLGTLFSNLDIDEIVISLQKDFDTVELIDELEIGNYME